MYCRGLFIGAREDEEKLVLIAVALELKKVSISHSRRKIPNFFPAALHSRSSDAEPSSFLIKSFSSKTF